MPTLTRNQITKLSVDEKLKLIDLLWDSVVEQREDMPVPEWQMSIVEERARRFRKNPNEGVSWSEVRRKLKAKRDANARSDH